VTVWSPLADRAFVLPESPLLILAGSVVYTAVEMVRACAAEPLRSRHTKKAAQNEP